MRSPTQSTLASFRSDRRLAKSNITPRRDHRSPYRPRLLCPSPAAGATARQRRNRPRSDGPAGLDNPRRTGITGTRRHVMGMRKGTMKPAATSSAYRPETDTRPILIVPYMWIGDFVRCHTVVKLLKARFPRRPVDMLTTALTLPLIDYMPGVHKGIVSDLPRGRLALAKQWELAKRLRAEGYGSVLVMPRTWKSALAPFLAGIRERTGFIGEGRLILLNDVRFGERKLDRMIDRKVALAAPNGFF